MIQSEVLGCWVNATEIAATLLHSRHLDHGGTMTTQSQGPRPDHIHDFRWDYGLKVCHHCGATPWATPVAKEPRVETSPGGVGFIRTEAVKDLPDATEGKRRGWLTAQEPPAGDDPDRNDAYTLDRYGCTLAEFDERMARFAPAAPVAQETPARDWHIPSIGWGPYLMSAELPAPGSAQEPADLPQWEQDAQNALHDEIGRGAGFDKGWATMLSILRAGIEQELRGKLVEQITIAKNDVHIERSKQTDPERARRLYAMTLGYTGAAGIVASR